MNIEFNTRTSMSFWATSSEYQVKAERFEVVLPEHWTEDTARAYLFYLAHRVNIKEKVSAIKDARTMFDCDLKTGKFLVEYAYEQTFPNSDIYNPNQEL